MKQTNHFLSSALWFTLFIAFFSGLHLHLLHGTEIHSNREKSLNIYFVTCLGDQLFSKLPYICADQDDCAKPTYHFKLACERLGHRFNLCTFEELRQHVKEADYIFSFNMIPTDILPTLEAIDPTLSQKLIIAVTEPHHVMRTNHCPELRKYCYKILTWDDTMVDNQIYFKRYFVQSSLDMIADIPSFSEKKLCTLICGNKYSGDPHELYSKRREAIAYFTGAHPNDFMFYGMNWQGWGFSSYGGVVESKTEAMKHYKFCICYENCEKLYGYITEKIFGCFIAGCVPIYWGSENIQDYIPKECFIDRREFDSYEELDQFISSMDEAEYQNYLDNIRLVLQSEKACPFSIDNFVFSMLNSMKTPGNHIFLGDQLRHFEDR